ncbi:MAG TPA: S8 family serine peptidase [Clostridia bacterium]|nr:S8 family serine peptidase [Clostridia bacterium]
MLTRKFFTLALLFIFMVNILQLSPTFAEQSIPDPNIQTGNVLRSNGIEAKGDISSYSEKSDRTSINAQTNDKGRIIVKYKNNNKPQMASSVILNKFPGAKLKTVKKLRLSKLDVMEVDPAYSDKVIAEYKKDPNVEYVQTDYKYFSTSTPSEPFFYEQWGLDNTNNIDINALKAWDITKGDSNLLVGVLDTGIDINHTDLNSNIYNNNGEISGNNIDDDGNGFKDDVNGWDFVNNDNSVFDSSTEDEHATHVAGIIAAKEDSLGVIGVAPNVKVIPLKFIKGEEGGYTSDAIEAIEYAKAMGIKVINCSWGSEVPDQLLMEEMRDSGILFICAAGNNGFWQSSPFYPACFDIPNIISVAAVDSDGNRAYFSNYGPDVDVAAPGMQIFSTLPGNSYASMSGTSMAAPFVTGIAALIKSADPTITNDEIKNRIISSVMVSDNLKENIVNSSGIVDAYASLVPLAAINLNAVSYENSITLNWGTDASATGYEIDDNNQIIDNQMSTSYTKSGLTAGTPYIFRVRAKYGVNRGNWSSRILKTTIEKGIGSGIRGEYFDGTELKNSKLVRTDEVIDFDQPADLSNTEGSLSVRWSGRIQPGYTEDYAFYTSVTGGVRLWVNDDLIIDEWDNEVQNEFSGTIKLDSDWKYFIRMEYKTVTGNVKAKLYWSSSSQLKEIIPKNRLISTPVIGGNIGTWSDEGMMPINKFSPGAASLDNKIYVMGGFDGIQNSNDHQSSLMDSVEEYDIETKQWVQKASMPLPSADFAAVAVNGKIYAIGGWQADGTFFSNRVYEFDQALNKWSTKATMPTERSELSAVNENNKIYAIGGTKKNLDGSIGITGAVEEYDAISDKWSQKESMITPRKDMAIAEVGGKIYTFGGINSNYAILDTVEMYDPILNKWFSVSSMPTVKSDAAAVVLDGKIYVMGGFKCIFNSNTGFYEGEIQYDVEEYDPILDKWTRMENMPTPRAEFGAVGINGRIYAMGGSIFNDVNTNDYALNTFESFDSNRQKLILDFTVDGQVGTSVIDQDNHTVEFTMPYGTNIKSLSPVITVSSNASITPGSGEMLDFAVPVKYVVTGGDGTTQEWSVKCTVDKLKIVIDSLTADKASPQPVNTPVTWSCSATGSTSLQYAFHVYTASKGWEMKQDYSSSNQFTWTPETPGEYTICTWVKDGASQNVFDTNISANFTVNGTEPVQATGLTTDIASPQPANTPVTWTCTAKGGTSLHYAFHVYSASKGWEMKQDYSSSNQFTWTPETPGEYTICTWVKDGASQNVFDTNISANFTVNGT